MSVLLALLIAVTTSALTGVAAGPVLRALPRPGGWEKPGRPWSHLPTPQWLCGLVVASFTATLAGAWLLPLPMLALWLVWCGPVALLVAIDAATTWLPLRLTHVCWALTVVALVVGIATGLSLAQVGTALACAAACGAMLWLWWWMARGLLGFGDVRLAPILGVVTGAGSASLTLWSLLAGSLVGAVWGVATRATGRDGAFPYGPALWLGPVVAITLSAWPTPG